MITKVKLEYFKRFGDQEFLLGDTVVLAGPNNSGKSTLLQAVAVWNLALQKWMAERGTDFGSESGRRPRSTAKDRTGVPISRKDFTAIPLREMNLLWSNRDTAYSKGEKLEIKAGEPKLVAIRLVGKEESGDSEWNLTVTLRYTSKEQIYVKLTDENGSPVTEVPEGVKKLKVVHVPPFSGIGAEETRYDRGYQSLLIGQGKPGDILRNLVLEVFQNDEHAWKALQKDITEIFGYKLLDPRYSDTDPFISVEYQDPNSSMRKPFDIASAGSGFHQVLTLLSFFYARPASILLLDEPDAHQHIILQRQVFDRLRQVAWSRRCQLLVATHSEIILEDAEPQNIVSFYGRPHRLEIDVDRDQVREVLKRLSSLDILAAESGSNVLYVEDESDFKILREFVRVLEHRSKAFFDEPFFYPIRGRNPREARAHFFALQAVRPDIKGVLLLDGDSRNLPDHEVRADGLKILRWKRYEIENYLVHPQVLLRFVEGPVLDLFRAPRRDKGETFLREELPPAVLADPLGDHEYLLSVPASKTFLPSFFAQAETEIAKKDYYQIASQMREEEIPCEVREKLDAISDGLGICIRDTTIQF